MYKILILVTGEMIFISISPCLCVEFAVVMLVGRKSGNRCIVAFFAEFACGPDFDVQNGC